MTHHGSLPRYLSVFPSFLIFLSEIMDILRIKKAHLPSPPAVNSRKRKERKVISVAATHDTDSGVMVPEAGSSTGVGTLSYANAGETGKDNDGNITGSEGD